MKQCVTAKAELAGAGVLRERAFDKEKLLVHPKLMSLLTRDTHGFEPYGAGEALRRRRSNVRTGSCIEPPSRASRRARSHSLAPARQFEQRWQRCNPGGGNLAETITAAAGEPVLDAVARIVGRLLAGTRWTDQEGRTRRIEPSDVLVVAPYNAQVSAMRRTQAPLGVTRVGTVDKFQGQKAPIVIYSCTASSPKDASRGMAFFLYDLHRFNVATSRARGAVIVVASPALFEPDCRTRSRCGGLMGFAGIGKGSGDGIRVVNGNGFELRLARFF